MKDFKYVIKRIFIGVGIGFLLMLIRGNVFADSIYSAQVPCSGSYGCSQSFGSTTGSIRFGDNFGMFADKTGYLYGSFAIVRDTYTESRPIVSVRYVIAFTSNGVYNCDFGSTSQNVSQYVGWSYSYTCPVSTGSGGVSYIQVGLSSVGGGSGVTNYNISFSDRFSFSIPTDNNGVEIRLDALINALTGSANSTASAINSQTQTIIQQEQATQSAINGNTQAVEDNTQATEDLNDDIMDSDTSTAQNQAGGFFSQFSSNSHGLSGIISAPLRLLNSISGGYQNCQSLVIPLPFVNQNVRIKCLTPHLWNAYFPELLSLYRTITGGLIAYWVCINFFRTVKGLQDPDSDKIEVFDL